MGLRFCMVTTFYPPHNFGGDGIGIQRFAQGLVRRGHEVTVLQDIDAYRVLSKGRPPPEIETDDGVELVPLQSRTPRLSTLLTQQLGRPVVQGRAIRRALDEGAFDVIVFNNVSLVGGPGVLQAGNALKLYMAHEHWLVCPSHVLWRHQREACTGRQCLRCVLSYRRPPQYWRYTGFLGRQLRHIDAFIAMSEFSRRKHKEFGFPRDMEVVNYFLPDRAPEDVGGEPVRPQERPYFLFVGRLELIKGLDDVIPTFRDYPEADLLIAGDGEHRAALERLAEGIPNVRFLGRLPPADLDALYRHAISLIVPSAGFETFGIIIIEAFRQGTPVIARHIGPFPEIIERGGGGRLFRTPEELVTVMRDVQGDSALRARLAEAAYAGFRDHWTEEAVMPHYLDVVRRTAQAKGRADIVEQLTTGEHE